MREARPPSHLELAGLGLHWSLGARQPRQLLLFLSEASQASGDGGLVKLVDCKDAAGGLSFTTRVKLSFARPSVDAMKEGKESVTPSPNVCLGKNRYKTGGLTVILCLALWSLVSGGAGIAIRWSVGIYPFSGTLAENGLDALASIIMPEILGGHMPKNSEVRSLAAWELAARARIVRWVWETYLKDPSTRISDFWHDAFEAAFEELERGDERARDAAFEEIAKLTVNVFELDEKSEKPNVQILTAEADPLAAFPSWRVEH